MIILIIFGSCTSEKPLENTVLWKISGNGLEKPSYLFGTIHTICVDDAVISDSVNKALEETQQIAFERNLGDSIENIKVSVNMYMEDGETIRHYLTKGEYATIDSFFVKTTGVTIEPMSDLKPTYMLGMALTKMIDCKLTSYELLLMEKAKEQNKGIQGLETMEEMFSVFKDISYRDQLELLLHNIEDNLATRMEEFKETNKLYKKSDITAMREFKSPDIGLSLKVSKEDLIDNRNKRWIPRIENYAKENPTFFAVGAAHLAGKDGLILLLREQGFTITPIMD